jgi:hypothetical protein
LQRVLKPGVSIRNWTSANGYLGDEFLIERVISTAIIIRSPGAKNLQHVPQGAFLKILDVWPSYKLGGVPRNELRDHVRFSKYVISILRWLETEVGQEIE